MIFVLSPLPAEGILGMRMDHRCNVKLVQQSNTSGNLKVYKLRKVPADKFKLNLRTLSKSLTASLLKCRHQCTTVADVFLNELVQSLLNNTHLIAIFCRVNRTSSIQYGNRKCGPHARVFSQTLAHRDSKNKIRHRNRGIM